MTGGVAIAPGRRVESDRCLFYPRRPGAALPVSEGGDRRSNRRPRGRGGAAAPHHGRTASAAPTLAAAVARLRPALPGAYAAAAPVDPRLLSAVVRITAAGGTISMDALTRATGTSSRWPERRFQAAVGAARAPGPSVRFRRPRAALDNNPSNGGVAAALDHGYYDQAHFIAEFRAFAGDAPRRFVDHRLAELTRFFVDWAGR